MSPSKGQIKKHSNIKENTELLILELKLQAQNSDLLSPYYSTALHALFLSEVQQINPQLSQKLHDNSTEKAFTISRLQGDLKLIKKQINITKGDTYSWFISALSKPVVDCLKEWLTTLPKSLNIHQVTFEVIQVQIVQQQEKYTDLMTNDLPKSLSLSFISPTSFRRQGNHFPLPLPYNLFHSYLRRWNDFSQQPYFSKDFLNWIDKMVIISKHQLQTSKVTAGKKGLVTGFTGAIEIQLSKEANSNLEYCQLYSALVKLAPYCGTGHKTTFGLGQTRLGWLLESAFSPLLAVETQLAQRIEELTNIFLLSQKRPSGDRAKNVCHIRAQILARREFSEALTLIASDLNMPYETVKTYVKIARKILKDSNINN